MSCCRPTRRRWRVVELARQAEQLRLQPRLDVRLAPALAGAVRHLQPDPVRHPPGHGRADGHQPGDPRLDRHRVAVRDPERHVRQPDDLRHRPRRLGGPGDQRQAGDPGHAARVDRRDPGAGQRRAGRRTRAASCGSRGAASSRLPIWVAAYGPKALALAGEVGDGFILQLADPDITAWSIAAVRQAAAERRPRPGDDHDLRGRAGLRHRRHPPPGSSTPATSAAGSAAWSATTSPTSSRATAPTARPSRRRCPTTSPAAQGYDYNSARQGRQHAHRLRAGRGHRPVLPARPGRGAGRAARASCGTSASTSSRSTCSTTPRTRRLPRTATASSRPSTRRIAAKS